MKLQDLSGYGRIWIQCHNNPDADAVCSAYVLSEYLESAGTPTVLFYSGRSAVSKPSLKYFIEEFMGGRLKFMRPCDVCVGDNELLLLVDCFYGERNVDCVKARHIACIDHHKGNHEGFENVQRVVHQYGSCCTVIWEMLKDEAPDMLERKDIRDSLFYGLYMDTSRLTAIDDHQTVDVEMKKELEPLVDPDFISRLDHSNMTREDILACGVAFQGFSYDPGMRLCIVETQAQCDTNLLGIIGDMFMDVADIDVSLTFSETTDRTYKFSVRSCVRFVAANILAEKIAHGVGNGGGHYQKAAGEVAVEDVLARGSASDFFHERIRQYFDSSVIIRPEDLSVVDMQLCRRKKGIVYGFVRAEDWFAAGDLVRRGNMEFHIAQGDRFVILPDRSLFRVSEELFFRHFTPTEQTFSLSLKSKRTVPPLDGPGKCLDLESAITEGKVHVCISTGRERIRVRKLLTDARIFSSDFRREYCDGFAGAYLAVSEEAETNLFVIRQEVFDEFYEFCDA